MDVADDFNNVDANNRLLSVFLLIVLIGMHLLLPIGNSLPTIKLIGIPIHLPMLVYPLFTVFILKLFSHNDAFKSGFVVLALFSCIQIVSLLHTSNIVAGSYEVFYNIFAIVGAYSIAWIVVSRFDKSSIAFVFSACLLMAAFIGIWEKLNSQPIWPYYGWYSGWYNKINSVSNYGEANDAFRIWGTMGNPINFAALLLMGIPWVLMLKNKFIKCVTTVVLLLSSALTLSRTIVFFVIPLSIYGIYVYVNILPAKRVRFLLVVSILVCCLWFFWGDKFAALWEARLALESLNPHEGFVVRSEIIALSLNTYLRDGNIVLWIFGFGQGSGGLLASRVLSFMDTLDNAYMAILFQNGLLGLMTFFLFWLLLPIKKGYKIVKSPHFWTLLGYLGSGASFEMYHYFGLNFLAFCSFAWLLVRE